MIGLSRISQMLHSNTDRLEPLVITGFGFVHKMQRHFLWLIVALALVRGLVYVSIIPPWQSPDEEFHFAQARLLVPPAAGQMAEDWQRELLDSLQSFGFYEFVPYTSPPLDIPERYSQLVRNTPPYWLYALAVLPWIEHEVVLQLYVMRLVSVFMWMGTTALVYLAGRELFPTDTFIPIVAAALVLFIPQHSYINASVNDGNLAELAASLTLYFLIRATVRGYSIVNVGLILASTILALWAKQTAYFLAFVVITVFAFTLWPEHIRNWRIWVGGVLAMIPIGWMFWQVKYLQGIFFPLRNFWHTLFNDPFVTDNFVGYGLVGYRSFWASLGWYVVSDDHYWWDGPTLVLIGLALVGALLSGVWGDSNDTLSSRRRLAIRWLGFSLLLAILEFILINAFLLTIHQRVQGRYLYVAVLPLVILLAFGWRRFVPETWERVVALALVVLLLLFDSAILLTYHLPFFHRL